ncbi:hypothetical protein GQ53DRAFT_625138, partial [Thozetella sp. PMI_491]
LLFWIHCGNAIATCYNVAGKASDRLYPCDSSGGIVPCCSANDFCLSNGLCLDGGGNNAFTQQGCTSDSWEAPCRKYCSGNAGLAGDGYIYMHLCSGFDAANPFCCSTDYTCCNSSANIITAIAHFSTMSHPVVSPATSSPSSATQSTSGTSLTSALSSTSTSTSSADIGGRESSCNSNSVAIGAGVGVPLGVAFIASLVALGWQMHKRRQ